MFASRRGRSLAEPVPELRESCPVLRDIRLHDVEALAFGGDLCGEAGDALADVCAEGGTTQVLFTGLSVDALRLFAREVMPAFAD